LGAMNQLLVYILQWGGWRMKKLGLFEFYLWECQIRHHIFKSSGLIVFVVAKALKINEIEIKDYVYLA
jgi:hypothetical protein